MIKCRAERSLHLLSLKETLMTKPLDCTDKAVLKAVIARAIDNGYRLDNLDWIPLDKLKYEVHESRVHWTVELVDADRPLFETSVYSLLFDHKFARAFWGEEEPGWQQHLQLMVLKENPIEYLKQFEGVLFTL